MDQAAPAHQDVLWHAVRQLTPRIREYVLGRSDGAPLPAYEAGAHIELYFSVDGEPVVRHYSLVGGVASQPDGPGVYRIAVQHSGRPRGSAFMHEHFALGSTLCISRPKNNFALNSFAPGRQGGKTLLVARRYRHHPHRDHAAELGALAA